MPKCARCGSWGLFKRLDEDGHCADCAAALAREKAEAEERASREAELMAKLEAEEAERIRKKLLEDQAEADRKAKEQEQKERREKWYADLIESIVPVDVCAKADPVERIVRPDGIDFKTSRFRADTNTALLPDFVVIDTETTGLSAETCEIIEIAAIRFRNFDPVERFVTLCAASEPIPQRVQAINHISDDMVAGKPRFSQVAEALIGFIGADSIVGHNVRFDLAFISQYVDVPTKKRKIYDTCELARGIVPPQKRTWDKEYGFWDYDALSGVEDYKLGTLCRWYGIYAPDGHRALGDALSTGVLFTALADEKFRLGIYSN